MLAIRTRFVVAGVQMECGINFMPEPPEIVASRNAMAAT